MSNSSSKITQAEAILAQSLELAVFPLPIFLLPGGRQRLRIFEPKYLAMVSHAAQGDGFIIATQDNAKSARLSSWGTQVSIVDFNMSDDQILEIDVEGKNLVQLLSSLTTSDGLIKGKFSPLPHWPTVESTAQSQVPNVFTAFLVQLFRDNESIRTLYPTPDFESPQWICARLLEMMPIPLEKKTEFTEPASFPSLVPFLNQIITGK
ncbi:LON peptidase substrate-binding domain-containing protein [uncultured Vibrio sp.]|uniref:LON peptidase substrate-binding domain-containing protein n=1 Tax=uncultured Vibrio sp. TaxID=114054 RepID=UPI002603935D|nr:LON peptidase substrate-binding domain-containing protein [uncultured Vibrio sp.]